MRTPVALFAAMLVAPILGAWSPAVAQETGMPPSGMNNPMPPPPGNSDNLDVGPDNPQAQTGQLVPLPGPPPENPAADLKLPDCAPPNCGTPQIMAP